MSARVVLYAYERVFFKHINNRANVRATHCQVVTACLAHGHKTGVFIAYDETVTHGADYLIEILGRVLQEISDVPPHICLQFDNTVAFS